MLMAMSLCTHLVLLETLPSAPRQDEVKNSALADWLRPFCDIRLCTRLNRILGKLPRDLCTKPVSDHSGTYRDLSLLRKISKVHDLDRISREIELLGTMSDKHFCQQHAAMKGRHRKFYDLISVKASVEGFHHSDELS